MIHKSSRLPWLMLSNDQLNSGSACLHNFDFLRKSERKNDACVGGMERSSAKTTFVNSNARSRALHWPAGARGDLPLHMIDIEQHSDLANRYQLIRALTYPMGAAKISSGGRWVDPNYQR